MQSIRTVKSAEFFKQLNAKKDTLKIKEDEQLCPNKVIQTVDEIVCDAESMEMPDTILRCLDDTIEYIAAHYGTEKAYPNNIESVILSRIYSLVDVHTNKNYSWHIFCSEVHDSSQASSRALHTNHQLLI